MPDTEPEALATRRMLAISPGISIRPHGRIAAAADRLPLVSVYLLIVTLIFLQRFLIPGTEISIALPAAFLVLVGLATRGHLVADVVRSALYLASVAACLLANVIVSAGNAFDPSFNSLLLLVVLYIPLCFRVSDHMRGEFPRVLEFFQQAMLVAAAFCVLQWAIQFAGIGYTDLFESILPPELIFSREKYNTTYPIYYGSPILKANGFVFLEASFASQFLALAIVVQMMIGGGYRRIALFGAALLTTVSGTGIALLAAGLLVLSVRRGGRWTARVLTAVAIVAIAVSFTPVGDILGERTGESAQAGSSGNARFIAPYVNVTDAIGQDQAAFLVGRGAGAVDVDVHFFNPTGSLVNYPALPKLLGEYGVPAALLFLTFTLVALLRHVPSPTLGLMAIVIHFVLSGSLLQPPTVYLCWLFTGLFAAARASDIAGRRITLSAAAAPQPRELTTPNAPGQRRGTYLRHARATEDSSSRTTTIGLPPAGTSGPRHRF